MFAKAGTRSRDSWPIWEIARKAQRLTDWIAGKVIARETADGLHQESNVKQGAPGRMAAPV